MTFFFVFRCGAPHTSGDEKFMERALKAAYGVNPGATAALIERQSKHTTQGAVEEVDTWKRRGYLSEHGVSPLFAYDISAKEYVDGDGAHAIIVKVQPA